MGPAEQLLAALALATWVGLWWVAVRAVSGAWLGLNRCAAVAILAWLIPLVASDLIAVRFRTSESPFLASWGGVALVIDGAWAARRVRNGYRARRDPKQAEPVAAPDTAG